MKRSRYKSSGGSYLASHDPREILGIGKAAKIETIEVRWPSGHVDKIIDVPINKFVKIVEGKGLVKDS
ncbi:MAG: ASPIC/UnbV domain-containing protein [Pyrinomonadaceae bacterium]